MIKAMISIFRCSECTLPRVSLTAAVYLAIVLNAISLWRNTDLHSMSSVGVALCTLIGLTAGAFVLLCLASLLGSVFYKVFVSFLLLCSVAASFYMVMHNVVIGYGVQKKKLVTGATVQVKGDNLQKMNTTNALQALQGQTPGVSIASTSGQPGAEMKVTVRGLGTVGKSGPLYVIDGVEGDITAVSPSDIESIDVLKDAASAAIYRTFAARRISTQPRYSAGRSRGGQIVFGLFAL